MPTSKPAVPQSTGEYLDQCHFMDEVHLRVNLGDERVSLDSQHDPEEMVGPADFPFDHLLDQLEGEAKERLENVQEGIQRAGISNQVLLEVVDGFVRLHGAVVHLRAIKRKIPGNDLLIL